jgi:hypothetical protein
MRERIRTDNLVLPVRYVKIPIGNGGVGITFKGRLETMEHFYNSF